MRSHARSTVAATVLLSWFLTTAAAPSARPAKPRLHAGASLQLVATAYCRSGTTQSGARARSGIVAADPQILPVGSIVRITEPATCAGIYAVMDTGAAIRGRILDIFIPSCGRAIQFGKRAIRLHVLRLGWNPKESAP
jgi:3D (Asp-Asp-Asp) domain-containing protein